MKFAKSLWTRPAGHLLAAVAMLVAASSASAASTWNTTSSCATQSGSTLAANLGNSLSCGASGGADLSVSGFSTTNGATSTTGTSLQTAAVYNWGGTAGLGVVNKYEDPSATGPHAIDNQYGTDMLLLSFSQAVDLTSIGLGWTGSDKDFSILAWTGTGAPTLTGKTVTGTASTSTLLSSGWTLVSNYGNSSTANVTTDLYSSYWLVSAYNTSFGTTSADGSAPTASTTSNYDAFKVLTVAANTCTGTLVGNTCKPKTNIPEPGSLALLGAAMIGLIGTTRRRNAKQV